MIALGDTNWFVGTNVRAPAPRQSATHALQTAGQAVNIDRVPVRLSYARAGLSSYSTGGDGPMPNRVSSQPARIVSAADRASRSTHLGP